MVRFPLCVGPWPAGLHDLGTNGWHWFVVDVLWAVAGGLFDRRCSRPLIGKLVVYCVPAIKSGWIGRILALGLMHLLMERPLVSHAYGFSGGVMQRASPCSAVKERPEEIAYRPCKPAEMENKQVHEALATDPEHASAYIDARCARLSTNSWNGSGVAVVLVVGAMLPFTYIPAKPFGFSRPCCRGYAPYRYGWIARRTSIARPAHLDFLVRHPRHRSIYYLMYAINTGLPRPLAERSPP